MIGVPESDPLIELLRETIERDRFPLSPWVRRLKGGCRADRIISATA